MIRSFVDAGNDLTTAEDIHSALHHGVGIKNADVAVVMIESKESMLSGPTTIPNISNYHSFQFFDDHMLMWRYFQIGKGKNGTTQMSCSNRQLELSNHTAQQASCHCNQKRKELD